MLWAIASGAVAPGSWHHKDPVDPLFLKGIVEELAVELGLNLAVDTSPNPIDPLSGLLHPGRQATIVLDGSRVGILGEVHPAVLKNAKIKRARPVYLEIRADALLSRGSAPLFVEPSNTHPMERDLAFSLPQGVEAGSVASVLHASDWLTDVRIVDRFDHDGPDGSPRRAITFRLTFDTSTDRSADEVNAALETLVDEIHRQYGQQGVQQR